MSIMGLFRKAETTNIINLTGDPNVAKGIIVPEGGKLFVAKVRVDPKWAWESILKEACPNYQSSDVLRVGQFFPPEPGEPKDRYVYGVNFGYSISDTVPAVEWGKANGLAEACPRDIYAVARDVPDLNRKVGMNWMYVVSPQFATFGGERRVCNAYFYDAKREARLFWFGRGWRGNAWFAFSREILRA
jgi:hypothetical protein